jgi:glycosyltransferase involved in cell wall biosynthesis
MSQTYEDFEFIISDNASTDGTSEQCAELAASDHRVRYFRNDQNLGAAFNHNRVAKLARGRYFKWCGHDDLMEPTFIERCVEVLDADTDCRYSLCFTLLDIIDVEGDHVSTPIQSPMFDDAEPHLRLRSFWSTPRMHQVIYGLMRRRLLLSTSLLGDWYGSDRQLLVEMALLGGFARVDEVLFHHREHPGRSQYVQDKRRWMTALDSTTREHGYWRRLGHMVEVLGRHYLPPRSRAAVAAEYTRYALSRAPHWIPQLGKELTSAAVAGTRRLTGPAGDRS